MKLDKEEKRSAVIHCYLTRSEKAEATKKAADVELSLSDLVRLLLNATTAEQALRLSVYADRRLPSGKA